MAGNNPHNNEHPQQDGRPSGGAWATVRRHGLAGPVSLPTVVDLPAGMDPVMGDLIGTLNSPDYDRWVRQVWGIGGCAHPLHLSGFTRARDSTTGEITREFSSAGMPGGVVLMRCGNRRASVCPACASIYSGDIYHLVRAGLAGGKGVPGTVARHPRVFATLTAPSFGAVHSQRPGGADGKARACHPRRSGPCQHGRPTSCRARHGDDDALLGVPLCADCYDYAGSVIWQASVGDLWSRFRTYLPRHLARLTGRSRREVREQVRLSFIKIVEYQVRGLVHVHAVVRADGMPTDGADASENAPSGVDTIPPPVWVSAELLSAAVASAARAVRLRVDGGSAGSWSLSRPDEKPA